MKNFLLLVALMFMASACTSKAEEAPSQALRVVKGEWRIINLNCPNVLAEKAGQRRVFRFKAARSINYFGLLRECRQMNGGTIIVQEDGKYYFFPLTSNQKKGG